MKKYSSLQERLLDNSKIVPNACLAHLPQEQSCCYLWLGHRQTAKNGKVKKGESGGYGRINFWYDGKSGKFITHRVAKVLAELLQINPNFNFYGNATDREQFFALLMAYRKLRLHLDHLCSTTECWNPYHTEWVSAGENIARRDWAYVKKQRKLTSRVITKSRHETSLSMQESISEWIKYIKAKGPPPSANQELF